jgi:hypothetical protein
LEAINDKKSQVQESVAESIIVLGKKKFDLIIEITFQFMTKNGAKLSSGHKVLILDTIEKVVKDNIDDLDEQLVNQWIEMASKEMISNKDKEASVSLMTSSSNLLVAIGKKYSTQVFNHLLKSFQAGVLPHLFIINTFANLAEINRN